MKTNVMIRIDSEVVQSAKELDLNLSKICEDALTNAVQELTRPYELIETSQLILEAELVYNIRDKILAIGFAVTNALDENIITDRINYSVLVTGEERLTDPLGGQIIQKFKGTILERRTIPPNGKDLFSERLIPCDKLAKRLSDVTYEDSKNLRWIIYPDLIADSRKRLWKAECKQVWDEKKIFPIPRPLKTV